jgi:hypothetical protein
MHLAQFNIARIRYPLDDPRMKEFVDNIDLVHRVADRIGGLVHRVQAEGEKDATSIVVFGDKTIVPNLTVWKDYDSLKKFVFQTMHKRFFDKKEQWFDNTKLGMPTNVMWYVNEGTIPTMQDGEKRLTSLANYGNSDWAFDWRYLDHAKI